MYTTPKRRISNKGFIKVRIRKPCIYTPYRPCYFYPKTEKIEFKPRAVYLKEASRHRTREYSVDRNFCTYPYNQLSKKYYLRREYKKW